MTLTLSSSSARKARTPVRAFLFGLQLRVITDGGSSRSLAFGIISRLRASAGRAGQWPPVAPVSLGRGGGQAVGRRLFGTQPPSSYGGLRSLPTAPTQRSPTASPRSDGTNSVTGRKGSSMVAIRTCMAIWSGAMFMATRDLVRSGRCSDSRTPAVMVFTAGLPRSRSPLRLAQCTRLRALNREEP